MTKLTNLSVLIRPCNSGMCPALYSDEQGRVYVQGTKLVGGISPAVASHEAVVEIAPELIAYLRSTSL